MYAITSFLAGSLEGKLQPKHKMQAMPACHRSLYIGATWTAPVYEVKNYTRWPGRSMSLGHRVAVMHRLTLLGWKDGKVLIFATFGAGEKSLVELDPDVLESSRLAVAIRTRWPFRSQPDSFYWQYIFLSASCDLRSTVRQNHMVRVLPLGKLWLGASRQTEPIGIPAAAGRDRCHQER